MNIKNELEKIVTSQGENIRLYDLEIDVKEIIFLLYWD